jgi:DNA replication protein DnaC
MLTHPTLEQMQALGLTGMAAAYRQLAEQDNAAELSRDEWLGLMLDRETAMRADRRLTNRLAAAKLRFADACIEDIDFGTRRGLDRRNILQLAQGAWLKTKENLIVTGQTGTGKTWLACAFARQAARLDARGLIAAGHFGSTSGGRCYLSAASVPNMNSGSARAGTGPQTREFQIECLNGSEVWHG